MTQTSRRRKKRKRRSKRSGIRRSTRRIIVIALAVWGVALAGLLWKRTVDELNRPLGEPLPQFPTLSYANAPQELVEHIETYSPYFVPTAIPPDAPEPQCGGPQQMILLVVGADSGSETFDTGLSDIIRVLRFDFITPSITMLTIPRGLWVPMPVLDDYSDRLLDYFGPAYYPPDYRDPLPTAYGLINVPYFYGNLYSLEGAGPGALAHTLYINFGLPIDHYAAVNMSGVARIIDDLGGVSVNIPYDVPGFTAGQQVLSGEDAVAYARIREIDSDMFRTQRQDIVLRALYAEFRSPDVIQSLPTLVDTYQNEILTDLSKSQIVSLACLASRISLEDIHQVYIESAMVVESNTEVGFHILLPHYDLIKPVVVEFLTGSDPVTLP